MKRHHLVRKTTIGLLCGAACLALFTAAKLPGKAAEANDKVFGYLQVLSEDTEVKEAASEESAAVGNLPAGTPVVVEAAEGDWCKILVQGMEGYVPADALGSYFADNVESLDAEMDAVAEAEQRAIEEFELMRKEKRASFIWGTVIALLIIVIFAVGVISTLKNAEREDGEEKQTPSPEKKRRSPQSKKMGKHSMKK